MPAVRGAGRWQVSILAALDGQPRYARQVVEEIVGRPPTITEYNAAHRAARQLIQRGQLTGWLEPGREHRLVIRKIGRWVRDGDGGRASEQEQARNPLAQFVDEAWAAFATDCGYAADIAQAAADLARYPRLPIAKSESPSE